MLLNNRTFLAAGGFNPALRMGEFMEWFARAKATGSNPVMLPEIVFSRRLHRDNSGRRRRLQRSEYAHALKAVLDLRRTKR